MKKQHGILLIFMFLFSMNFWGREICVINTKDLLRISNEFGLDSAIRITREMPIYILDRSTTDSLINQAKYCRPTYDIEHFLVDYALNVKTNRLFPDILLQHFENLVSDSDYYKPNSWGWINHVWDNELVALKSNRTSKTDSVLIAFYNRWLQKTIEHKSKYLEGIKLKDSRQKEILTSPFETVTENCYLILLALRDMKSTFATQEKLQMHLKYLKYYTSFNSILSANNETENYNSKKDIYLTIKLTRPYKSIGEIEIQNEPALNNLISGYNKSYCWKYIWYNITDGFLDLGCQSGPLAGGGAKYRLELSGKILKLYVICDWIS